MKWTPTHHKTLVCVYWRDAEASAPNEAFYEEEIRHHTRPMETYGLLMKQDAEGVTVMTEFYTEDDGKGVYRGKTFIPGSLVDRIDVLAAPYKKKSRGKVCSRPQDPLDGVPKVT